MKSAYIQVWKFLDAPRELQLLYNGPMTPEWITLVPRAMRYRDLDDEFARNTKEVAMSRCDLANGDVVYIGAPQANQLWRTAGEMAHARAH
jgi:hypothetical protein